MLNPTLLMDWLATIVPKSVFPPFPPFEKGPYINAMPDRVVHVSLLPGLGYAMEGAMDQPSFQLRCRGDQQNQDDAAAIAQVLDQAIYAQHFPQVFEGVKFALVTRLSGAPAPLGPPDDGFRYEYVCTYRTMIGVS